MSQDGISPLVCQPSGRRILMMWHEHHKSLHGATNPRVWRGYISTIYLCWDLCFLFQIPRCSPIPDRFQVQKLYQWTKIIRGAFNYVTNENVVSKGVMHWSSPTPTAVKGRAPIDTRRCRIRVVGNCFENQMEKSLWTASAFPFCPLFTHPHPSLCLPSCGEMMH